HRKIRVEGEASRHVADAATQIPHVGRDIASEHRHAALIGEYQRYEYPKQSCLSGAVRPDESKQLPRRDRESHIVQRRSTPEAFAKSLDRYCSGGCRCHFEIPELLSDGASNAYVRWHPDFDD